MPDVDVTEKTGDEKAWAGIKYVVLFLIPKEETLQFNHILDHKIDYYFYFLVYVIIIFLIVLFLVIGAIVIIFTNRITAPIQTLTQYTTNLKHAEDKQSKEKVVEDVQKDPIFKEISAQYEANKKVRDQR